MKSKLLLLLSWTCFHAAINGQPILNGEVRNQKPNSFYSSSHSTNDELIEKEKYGILPKKGVMAKAKNYRNPPNTIVENFNNPKGTVVLEGGRSPEELKMILNDPEKLVIKGNFTEVCYVKNDLLFKIPTYNVSKHFELKNPEVQLQLTDFVKNYVLKINEVPGSIDIDHNYNLKACEFYGFRSLSSLYSRFLYSQRLNLSCATLDHLLNNSLCLLIYTNEKHPAD